VPRLRLAVAAGLLMGVVSLAAAQDKQNFQTKFDKPFYQKLTTKVEQTLKVQGGSDVPLKHEQTFYFKWTPISTDKDKTVAKMAIEGVQFKMDIAGQTIEYDSTNPNPAGPAGNPGLAEFFKNLVGSELTVTFKNGHVESVAGREELQKKLAAVNPQMEQVLRSVLTDDAIKEMADPSAGLTPNPLAEKSPNDTWKKTTTLSLGPIGSYVRTFTYTYKGKDAQKKELDRIEVKPELQYKPPTGPSEGLPFRIKSGKLDTKEVKQGLILFNPKAGRVEQERIHIVLSGDLDVTIGNADSKVSLTQDQLTELDSSDQPLLPKAKK
jgi:hypothetical protein